MTLVRSGGSHAIRGKPCSGVRTPEANPFAPLVGRPAFLQGEVPRLLRCSGPARPGHLRNPLLRKQLT